MFEQDHLHGPLKTGKRDTIVVYTVHACTINYLIKVHSIWPCSYKCFGIVLGTPAQHSPNVRQDSRFPIQTSSHHCDVVMCQWRLLPQMSSVGGVVISQWCQLERSRGRLSPPQKLSRGYKAATSHVTSLKTAQIQDLERLFFKTTYIVCYASL